MSDINVQLTPLKRKPKENSDEAFNLTPLPLKSIGNATNKESGSIKKVIQLSTSPESTTGLSTIITPEASLRKSFKRTFTDIGDIENVDMSNRMNLTDFETLSEENSALSGFTIEDKTELMKTPNETDAFDELNEMISPKKVFKPVKCIIPATQLSDSESLKSSETADEATIRSIEDVLGELPSQDGFSSADMNFQTKEQSFSFPSELNQVTESSNSTISHKEQRFFENCVNYLYQKLGRYRLKHLPSFYTKTVEDLISEMLECYSVSRSRSNMIKLRASEDETDSNLIQTAVYNLNKDHGIRVKYVSIDGFLHNTSDEAVEVLYNAFGPKTSDTESEDESEQETASLSNLFLKLDNWKEDCLVVICIRNMDVFVKTAHDNEKLTYSLFDYCFNDKIGNKRLYLVATYKFDIFMDRRINSRFDKVVHTLCKPQSHEVVTFIYDSLSIDVDNHEVKTILFKESLDLVRDWNHKLALFLKENDEEMSEFRWSNNPTTTLLSFCKHLLHHLALRMYNASASVDTHLTELCFTKEDLVKTLEASKPISLLESVELTKVEMNLFLAIVYFVLIKKLDEFNFESLYYVYETQIIKQGVCEVTETMSRYVCLKVFQSLQDKLLIYKVHSKDMANSDNDKVNYNENKYLKWYRLTYNKKDTITWLKQKQNHSLTTFQKTWFTYILSHM